MFNQLGKQNIVLGSGNSSRCINSQRNIQQGPSIQCHSANRWS